MLHKALHGYSVVIETFPIYIPYEQLTIAIAAATTRQACPVGIPGDAHSDAMMQTPLEL
jgi:hypothetical protein